MSGGLARLAARFPRVWHVIEADGAGPWLVETGLLPAIALRGDSANRDDFVSVDLGSGRTAILRPQQMPDRRLLPTLSGAFAGCPDLWREHVNRHVFFWADRRRRDAFLQTCVRLRGAAHARPVAMVVDTAGLLGRHGDIAWFATINTGSTVRGGARARRDENTLRPASAYQSGPIAELAIRGRVDLSGLIVGST